MMKNDIQKEIAKIVGKGFKGSYATIVYKGKIVIEGDRYPYERINVLRLNDLSGKTVLDIGCNIGTMSFHAVERGAQVTGIDISPDAIMCANMIKEKLALDDQINFCQFDIADKRVLDLGTFDMVFFFSVWRHIPRLQKRFWRHLPKLRRSMKNINKLTNEFCYIEGHPISAFPDEKQRVLELGKKMDFKQFEFLGYSDNSLSKPRERPIWLCKK